MKRKLLGVIGSLAIAGSVVAMLGTTSAEQPATRTDGFVPFPAWVNDTSSTGRYQTSTSGSDLRTIMLMRERVVVPNTTPPQFTTQPVWIDTNLISEIHPAPPLKRSSCRTYLRYHC